MISLPKIPYIHRIYRVLANTHTHTHTQSTSYTWCKLFQRLVRLKGMQAAGTSCMPETVRFPALYAQLCVLRLNNWKGLHSWCAYIYDVSASTCLSSSYVRYVLIVDRVLIVDVRVYMMYRLARAYQAAMCATSWWLMCVYMYDVSASKHLVRYVLSVLT